MKHSPIARIALPSIVSNLTVPLLGLADTAITGHLGSAAAMASIALGGMVFNMVYWLCNFLRMGTGSLTSQAYGARQTEEAHRLLARSLCLGLALAVVFFCLQQPIFALAMTFVEATPQTEGLTAVYFSILIWGAPAMMAQFSLNGWLLGMQDAFSPMLAAITQNVVNVAVSLMLVFGLHMGVSGVATGTLVAQYVGVALLLVMVCRRHGVRRRHLTASGTFTRGALWRFFRINTDIFFRTLCLVAVTTCFTAFSSALGETALAANTLLMQFFIFFSYFMDGFAYAGEALGGKYVGARHRQGFDALTRRLLRLAALLACVFVGLYGLAGHALIACLTDLGAVRATAGGVLWAVCLVPLAGAAAFIFDGLFIGAAATREMLTAMATACLVFFAVHALLTTDVASLWWAFIAYLATRSLAQALLLRRVRRKSFS